MTMKWTLSFVSTLAALALAGTAAGSGRPVVNDTTVTKDVSDTYLDVNPCTGGPAIWTSVAHGVFHVTAFADGTVHVRATFNSRFTVDTIDPSEADFSGHAEDGFSFSGDGGTAVGTSTFTPILKGTDGSKLMFHYTLHFTANASGDVTVEFDRATSRVTCP